MSSFFSSLVKNTSVYKSLSCATALLYFALFLTLLFFPGSLLDNLGIAESESAIFISRRASMLMLGFSVISFCGRDLPSSTARQAIILAIGVNMAGFAVMSIFEFLRGFANTSILQAAFIETILAIVYFLLLWAGSRQQPIEGNSI